MEWNTIRGLVPVSGVQPDLADCLDAFPVLQRAKETPQEPRYHGEGDVWTHTIMVVESLLQLPDYQQPRASSRKSCFLPHCCMTLPNTARQ